MKKYFAKYLPVEEEIKNGDSIIFDGYNGISTRHDERGRNTLTKNGIKLKKVKLFLCSIDIQVGDYIRSEHSPATLVKDIEVTNSLDTSTPHWEAGNDYLYDKKLSFKVIGEISSEAIWIKEGDEFDENEIKKVNMQEYGHYCDWIEGREQLGYKCTVLIFGPCKHFH